MTELYLDFTARQVQEYEEQVAAMNAWSPVSMIAEGVFETTNGELRARLILEGTPHGDLCELWRGGDEVREEMPDAPMFLLNDAAKAWIASL